MLEAPTLLRVAAALSLVTVAAPIALSHDHPASQQSVVQLPGEVLSGQVFGITGIGPPGGTEILHVTWDVTFKSNGTTPASELRFDVSVPVDGGTKTWKISGADLGFGAGAGTYSGTLGTDALNGEATASLLLPNAILDIHLYATNGGIHGQFVNSKLIVEWNDSLTTDVDEISVANGGSQALQLAAGAAFAGDTYLVLGSVSGTAPGTALPGGAVPLNLDPYFLFTLANPNTPLLTPSMATLDAAGSAAATFTLPPSGLTTLVGVTVHHVYVVLDAAGGAITFASIPADLTFTP